MPFGICTDHSKITSRTEILVGYARGNNDDIPRMHFMNHTTFTAQLHPGSPAIDAKHFVSCAVVVVIGVNAVPPTAMPTIFRK